MPEGFSTFRLIAGTETQEESEIQSNWDICRLFYEEVLCPRWTLPLLTDLIPFRETGRFSDHFRMEGQNVSTFWRATALDLNLPVNTTTICTLEVIQPFVWLDLIFTGRGSDVLLQSIEISTHVDANSSSDEFFIHLMTAMSDFVKKHHLLIGSVPEQGPAHLLLDGYERKISYRSWRDEDWPVPPAVTVLQPCQEKREDAFWYSGEVARTETHVLFSTREVTCRFYEEGNPDVSDQFHDDEARKEARDRNITDEMFNDYIHFYLCNGFEIHDRQTNQIMSYLPETWTAGINLLKGLTSQHAVNFLQVIKKNEEEIPAKVPNGAQTQQHDAPSDTEEEV